MNVKAKIIFSAHILMNVMRHAHRMQWESIRIANVATHPNITTKIILFAEVLLDDHARLPLLELDHTVCASMIIITFFRSNGDVYLRDIPIALMLLSILVQIAVRDGHSVQLQ